MKFRNDTVVRNGQGPPTSGDRSPVLQFEAVARLVIVLAEAGLTAALALVAAKIFWLVVDPAGRVTESRPLMVAKASAEPSASVPTQDFARLLTQSPFEGAGPATEVTLVPKTELNLTLKGVRAEDDERAGMAIISVSGGPAKTYQAGDEVLEGVTLDRVLPDRVILMKRGKAEGLLMPSTYERLSVIGNPPNLDAPDRQGFETAGPVPAQETSSPLSREDILSLKFEPVTRQDEVYGYRVASAPTDRIVAQAGIMSGDIVIGIDNRPVRDISLKTITNKLSGPDPLRLQMQRGGDTFETTLLPLGYDKR